MTSEKNSENKTKEVSAKMQPTGIDINSLVNSIKGTYAKKEQGLANQISTGKSILRPNKDSDFILWPGEHWAALCGIKGLPFGRIVQISGKPDSGKSTHAAVFMREAQAKGYLVILFDTEGKFSKKRYDSHIGGNSDTLLIIDTKSILEGIKAVAHSVVKAKEHNPNIKILIVWDSVGASTNSTEIEEEEDYSKQPGVTAKEVSYAVRKLNSLLMRYFNREIGEHTISVLVINQVYANIGFHGDTEKGGSELYYLSSLILQLSRKSDLTHVKNKQKMKFGIVTRAKVKKNHLFEQDEAIAELDLIVSAKGIELASTVRNEFLDESSDE